LHSGAWRASHERPIETKKPQVLLPRGLRFNAWGDQSVFAAADFSVLGLVLVSLDAVLVLLDALSFDALPLAELEVLADSEDSDLPELFFA
jgi:hypothetical protein